MSEMSERRSDAWATEVFDTILRSIRKNDFIMDLFEDEVDEADVVWALRRARNEAARRIRVGDEPAKHKHNWVIFDELADQEQCTICGGYILRDWDPDRTRQRLEREKAKESEAAGDGR